MKWVYLFIIGLLSLFIGCKETGVYVTVKDTTATELCTITLTEYTIPAFSYVSGPTFSAWVNKDFTNSVSVSAKASITNNTNAIGLYNGSECKSIAVDTTVK